MSDSHKAALAVGRDEGRAVRRYLEALEAHRPRPGRKRTAETVQRQLRETIQQLNRATALERVHLLQRRLDLEHEIERMQRDSDLDLVELETAFVTALPGYSDRKHISYAAWREVGVPARVLRAAGVSRAAS
ncbi:MAG: hypothetical protein ACRDQH_03790 [Pseudonocardiaceae bacterium]